MFAQSNFAAKDRGARFRSGAGKLKNEIEKN
jgi:hypothetical protein